MRALTANLHRVGKPLEAALRVYKRYRRSVYEHRPFNPFTLLGGLGG